MVDRHRRRGRFDVRSARASRTPGRGRAADRRRGAIDDRTRPRVREPGPPMGARRTRPRLQPEPGTHGGGSRRSRCATSHPSPSDYADLAADAFAQAATLSARAGDDALLRLGFEEAAQHYQAALDSDRPTARRRRRSGAVSCSSPSAGPATRPTNSMPHSTRFGARACARRSWATCISWPRLQSASRRRPSFAWPMTRSSTSCRAPSTRTPTSRRRAWNCSPAWPACCRAPTPRRPAAFGARSASLDELDSSRALDHRPRHIDPRHLGPEGHAGAPARHRGSDHPSRSHRSGWSSPSKRGGGVRRRSISSGVSAKRPRSGRSWRPGPNRAAGPFFLALASMHAIADHLRAGALDAAEAALADLPSGAQASPNFSAGFAAQLFLLRRSQGRVHEFLPLLDVLVDDQRAPATWHAGRVLALAETEDPSAPRGVARGGGPASPKFPRTGCGCPRSHCSPMRVCSLGRAARRPARLRGTWRRTAPNTLSSRTVSRCSAPSVRDSQPSNS